LSSASRQRPQRAALRRHAASGGALAAAGAAVVHAGADPSALQSLLDARARLESMRGQSEPHVVAGRNGG